MASKPLHLLFDADMIVFRTCAAAEQEINWYGDLWTLHSDLAEVKDAIDTMIVSITDKVLRHMEHEGAYDITMCFSSYPYFRSKVYPPYKLNRVAKRKPLAYHSAVEWVKKNYNVLSIPNLEADDLLGIYGTRPSYAPAVIISGDKDMRSIPCPFYNFIQDTFHKTTQEEADYQFLYQTLVGDATDNYKGCPKIGEVGAKKILDKDCSWDAVVAAYAKAGLSEEEALTQARVARILRYEDVDYDDVDARLKPILWTPKGSQKRQ